MPRPKKVIKSSIDTGTPPAGVLEARKAKESLLSTEDEATPTVTDVDGCYKHYAEAPVEDISLYEKIQLEHDLYELTFRAMDVSISKHQIAVKISNSLAFQFEPKVDSVFQITYRNKAYTAVYLGGIFNFSSDNSWAITFIINKETKVGEINERIRE